VSSEVQDILAGSSIGDPFSVTGRPGTKGKVYGRLTGFAGTEYRGHFPQVIITTPHGTDITTGRVWCHLITRPDELAQLAGFEEAARDDGEWYGGKLPPEGNGGA
jgi:hypothetical protein